MHAAEVHRWRDIHGRSGKYYIYLTARRIVLQLSYTNSWDQVLPRVLCAHSGREFPKLLISLLLICISTAGGYAGSQSLRATNNAGEFSSGQDSYVYEYCARL